MANKINIVITAEDKASKPLRSVSEAVDDTSKNTSIFSSVLATAGRIALTAGVAGFAAITSGAIAASAASFEQVKAVEEARYGLMAYEKDGTKVNKVLGDLVAYAKSDAGVLFNRADLFAAASTLKMYGNETETLTDRVQILSKGVAMGKTTFQELSAIVGRAAAKGRLDAVDFDMLIERGIGLDRSFRGSAVGAEELYAALNNALPDEILSGRANTIQGRMVRLQSAFRSVGDAILGVDKTSNEFIKGGLGDRFMQGISGNTELLKKLAPVVRDVTTWILDFSDNAIAKATDAVGWLGDKLKGVPDIISSVVGWIKDRFVGAVDLGRDAMTWLSDRVADVNDGFEDFKGWLSKNETAIKSVATVLGVIFGPALIRAGVLAVIQGVKIAGSGIAAGAGWLSGAVQASVAWTVNGAKSVVMSAINSAKMIGHAVAVGVAHSVHAVKSTVAWTINFAKMLVLSSVSSVKMAIHAADVGWAWVFNGTRATIAWVTQTLPKIVVASATTLIAATRHAIGVGAAWVASASRAAIAWVVTELPRIVTGFFVTSTASVTHAATASAAWIASATKSAVAWVVTELPRIIGAFVAMAASAVAEAAVASTAWVASATTSSASVQALKLLVSTPMVMPAIAVAAAVAALFLVEDAANKARDAVENAARIKDEAHKEDLRMISVINESYKSGEYSKEKRDQMLSIIGRNASGTNAWSGGPTLINEHGPEIINLPQGSQVTPAYRSRQSEGGGSGSPTVVIENYNSYNERDDNRFFRDLGFALELAS